MPKENYQLRVKKQDTLKRHIPFVEEMLVKVKGSRYEKNLKLTLEIITSNRK